MAQHWIDDTDAEWEARRERYLADMAAWRARQLGRRDWGGALVLLGCLLPFSALVAPYACMGSGLQPDTVIGAMIGIALTGVALLLVGLPFKARFDAADPRPEL